MIKLSLFSSGQIIVYGLDLHSFLPTANLFNVGDVGVFLALKDCIYFFQGLAFCLDPENSLMMCE